MIVVVMGVSGSGKTTIGFALAAALGCTFLDADVLHPRANVDKMRHGIPLDDADRAPWLAAVHAQLVEAHGQGDTLVVACSALKARYRVVLSEGVPIVWVYLKGSADLIRARMEHRRGHFMKAGMLESQFEALEEPDDAIVVDVAEPVDANIERVLHALRRLPASGR